MPRDGRSLRLAFVPVACVCRCFFHQEFLYANEIFTPLARSLECLSAAIAPPRSRRKNPQLYTAILLGKPNQSN
jgi:hypothetical protein